MLCSERQQLSCHPGGITRTTNGRENCGLQVNLGVLITHSSSGIKLHVWLGTTTAYHLVTGENARGWRENSLQQSQAVGQQSPLILINYYVCACCILLSKKKKNLCIMSKEKSSKQIPNVTLLLFIRLLLRTWLSRTQINNTKTKERKWY